MKTERWQAIQHEVELAEIDDEIERREQAEHDAMMWAEWLEWEEYEAERDAAEWAALRNDMRGRRI